MQDGPSQRMPSPKLLDTGAVAQRLNVSCKTVRRLIARHELPVHRIGRLLRVSEIDLDNYIASRRQVKRNTK